MIVDVSWDGVKLATGAQAREEACGWFVELEQPMPVGTRLQLDGEAQATVRVARVHEGLGAGMLVTAEGATSATKPAEPVAADAAKAAESAAAGGDDKEPDEAAGGPKRDRRRKRKPTGPH